MAFLTAIKTLIVRCLIAVVILLAVVSSLGRYYLPYIADYQQSLLTELSKRSGILISAKKIRGDWAQLSPIVTVYNGQIGPQDSRLEFAFAELELDLLRSLWHRSLIPSRVEVAGVALPVIQQESGKFVLDFSWFPKTPSKPIDVLALYDGLSHVALRDAKLSLRLKNGDRFKIDYFNVEYTKQYNDWRIVSHGLPDDAAIPVNFLVEGVGLPSHQQYELHAYAKMVGLNLSPYLARLDYQGWQPGIDQANGELWFDYGSNKVLQLQGKLDLEGLRFAQRTRDQRIVIPKFNSQFKAHIPDGKNLSVWLRDLDVTLSNSEQIQFTHAQLLPEKDNLTASFDSIEVEPVQRLLRQFEVLPEGAQQILGSLAPSGWLHDITVSIPNGRDFKRTTVAARLEDISVAPWKGAPGGKGVNGLLYASADRGIVKLSSKRLSLAFPTLYKHALEFDSAEGLVSWQINDKRFVRVQSSLLKLNSEAGAAKAYFDLDIPILKEDAIEFPPHMNLVVELTDTDAEFRNQFIPYTLNKGLRDWLQDSIKQGVVTDGALVFRGPLTADAELSRTAQLFFDIRKGRLRFDEKWPEITELSANLFIDDSNVLVEASQGRLSQLQLRNTEITFLPQANDKGGVIAIGSDLRGDMSGVFKLFEQSPIGELSGSLVESWDASGHMNAKLDVRLPIGTDDGQKEQVDVRARLRNVTLENKALRLKIEDINGPIRFRSDAGLTSTGLIATLWDDAISAKLVSNSNSGGEGQQSILKFSGVASSDALMKWLRVFELNSYVDGEFSYTGALTLANEDSHLSLHSDLHALKSSFPAPMTKALGVSRPLDINIFFDEAPARIHLRLGELLHGALVLNNDKPISGGLQFGSVGDAKYNSDGIHLGGAIGHLELNPWLTILSQLQVEKKGGQRQVPSFYVRHIDIAQVDMLAVEFEDVAVSLAATEEDWTVAFESPRATGRVVNSGWPLDVQLEKLYLPAPAKDVDPATDTEILADVFPAEIPAMTFSLADLWVGDDNYGQWSFRVTPIQHGTEISEVNATIGGMQIGGPAVLRWRRVGDQQQSEFEGLLTCGDLGVVLDEWHYDPAIRSKSCRFGADLSWYGSPLGFEIATFNGKIDVELTNGQFLESNSTANVLRIFSLFNFDTILRRLQFNFSDVFNRGLSYDHIQGSFELNNGQLILSETLDVKGPSSSFQMNGSIDMINETVDTDLVLTLPITSNLPWVAALAGGLPVAAGVYVAGKIFQKQVAKLSSASYTLKGSWDEPELKLKSIFDDEGEPQDKKQKADKESAQSSASSRK